MRTTRTRRTTLAAVATALALAVTAATPLATAPTTTATRPTTIPATIPATIPTATEVGGGPGMTCLGCIVAGTVAVMNLGPTLIVTTVVTGGAPAVAIGSAVSMCVAACYAYFTED